MKKFSLKERLTHIDIKGLILGIAMLLLIFTAGVRFSGYLGTDNPVNTDRQEASPAKTVDAPHEENEMCGIPEVSFLSQERSVDDRITSQGLININTATLVELEGLDGIGTIKAQAIIDARETNGNFVTKEQIMNVSGIGSGTYEDIREYICVE